jgi:hypothetical protein
MRLVFAFLLTLSFVWAEKPDLDIPEHTPKLTVEQKLEIRDLQVKILDLSVRLSQMQRTVKQLQRHLNEKVKEFTPKGYVINGQLDLIKTQASPQSPVQPK